MQTGMDLRTLLTTVVEQNEQKRDFVTSTQDNIRMILADSLPAGVTSINPTASSGSDQEVPANKRLRIVMLREGNQELERFGITENAHRQIASRLEIPWKFYTRLTHDHPDMLCQNVNRFFEAEPQTRLFRALGGNIRAFLSDRYRALDNQEVLEMTLPAILETPAGDHIPTQVLGGNVSEDHMNLKVLFEGEHLQHEITRNTRTGEGRIMQPGFRLTNSETGNGALKFEAFFYDSYCLNGCVFGKQEGFSFSRNHIGGKLIEGIDYQVVSDDTRKLQDQTIIAEVRDGIKAISDPKFVGQMIDKLREAAASEPVSNPVATVDLAIKELDLRESERDSILTTFLKDGDLSKFGLASAVTSVANNSEQADYARANELENVGAQILGLSLSQWNKQYVNVAA
jgi:hypothetical protein